MYGCAVSGFTEASAFHHAGAIVDIKTFKEKIKPFVPYLFKVNLYDEGEPFLNKNIYDIIEYLHKSKVATCVSSNFSIKFSADDFHRMVSCGLDHLIVCIDGYNQETYAKYRVGGDFDLVISNLKRVCQLIKETKSKLRIETQFLKFPDITPEFQQKVLDIVKEMDVWRHIILENCSRLGWAEIAFKGNEQERVKAGCYQTWFSGVILPDGNYYSCDYGEDHGMKPLGVAERFLIDDLHNCETNRNLRESFNKGNICKICRSCPLTANKSIYNIKTPKA